MKASTIQVAMVLTALVAGMAQAAPLMESGVGTRAPLLATVLRDHEVPHLYYVFPQRSELARNSEGRPQFAYHEVWRERRWGAARLLRAEAQFSVRLSIETPELRQKVAEIQKDDPAARFAVIPIFRSEVRPSPDSDWTESACEGMAGPPEVPVFCRLRIPAWYAVEFRKLISQAPGGVLHYGYSFYGYADERLQIYRFAIPLVLQASGTSTVSEPLR